MRDFVSEKARRIKPSGIRKFFDIVAKSSDVISLGIGEPDFVTPWEIRSAAYQSLQRGQTSYTGNRGLPALTEEIARYLGESFGARFSPEEIVVTIGASEAIDAALRATVDDGDEVLVPDPSYVSYAPCVELCGGKAVSVPCRAEDGFVLTPEAVERAVTDRTKILIFPYPNNPTGGIMTRAAVEALIPVVLKHDLLILADEIYAELTYGGSHVSAASFPALKDRVVLVSGFSKAFAMTGWRIGYVAAPGEILQAILKIHQYTVICAPSFSQYAALAALREGREDSFAGVSEMREEYDKRRKFLYQSFLAAGLTVFEPKGAFYIFPSVRSTGLTGEEFAERLLLEERVAVVPGGAFGASGADHIRCSYAASMQNLIAAADHLRLPRRVFGGAAQQ